ncbi:hypothetical protein B4135_3079 [Caldibacillus debilis]|uniref:Uncharacterized protein n=1 Tax=Caldibacillus debilis TaxID=301148 RepID=A0A150LIT7_9BACI|nr:hypothetical protein B4135_3079 [Caldibacillus debilis]
MGFFPPLTESASNGDLLKGNGYRNEKYENFPDLLARIK